MSAEEQTVKADNIKKTAFCSLFCVDIPLSPEIKCMYLYCSAMSVTGLGSSYSCSSKGTISFVCTFNNFSM